MKWRMSGAEDVYSSVGESLPNMHARGPGFSEAEWAQDVAQWSSAHLACVRHLVLYGGEGETDKMF